MGVASCPVFVAFVLGYLLAWKQTLQPRLHCSPNKGSIVFPKVCKRPSLQLKALTLRQKQFLWNDDLL